MEKKIAIKEIIELLENRTHLHYHDSIAEALYNYMQKHLREARSEAWDSARDRRLYNDMVAAGNEMAEEYFAPDKIEYLNQFTKKQ